MKRTLYLCRCESIQHSFVVSSDDEDLFIEVHLSPLPLLQRIVHAVRYVLGGLSKYGDFESILLSPADALELGDRITSWSTNTDKI